MEREPISTLTPLPGASQPLLTPVNTVTDDNENKDGGVGLRTLSRIPADSITDNKDADRSYFIQSAVLLPASGSIQADIIERMSDDPETPADYQPLTDDDKSTTLYDFLASLGITRQQIDRAQIPKAALLKLYQQEFSYFSWLKWSSLDHAVEKHLQWPLLSPTDIGSGEPKKCDYRVRPHERSILLKTTWGLIKAYAVRGFVQGMEMGLLGSVHYFIYAMLAYRLGELAKTGQSDFEEFQTIFSGSSQKGIDSLVRSLAGLESRWLKLILAAPFILGAGQGIVKMRGARPISIEEIKKTADRIQTHLEHPGSFWRNVVLEKIPLLSSCLSLSNQVQKLERWVRWDGRLDYRSRQQAFALIRRVAWEGEKITQINALESLAKIAHGISLKDFPRLQRAGYSLEELTGILYIKATALTDLEALSQRRFIKEKISKSGRMVRLLIPLPRRLYASYLLWWLGQSTSWWTQRLPFTLLKTVKLGLEALFLQKIAASILEAINCPDKPGFRFGNGYQDWAGDYTAQCFITRISFFRTLDINESVDSLVAEIPEYHLTDLIALNLHSKYLTSDEARKIIQAVVRQGALLQDINLWVNELTSLDNEIFAGLNNLYTLNLHENKISNLSDSPFADLKNLRELDLALNKLSSLNADVFIGLSNLQILELYANSLTGFPNEIFAGLGNLQILDIGNMNLGRLNEKFFVGLDNLQSLSLYDDQLITLQDGVFASLRNLKELDLGSNQLRNFSDNVFSGLNNLQILSLSNNQLGNLNGRIFADLYNLQNLYLSTNLINTSALIDALTFFPITLISLDISYNSLSSLPDDFAQRLPLTLTELSIGHNSFIPTDLDSEFMRYFPSRIANFMIYSSGVVNIVGNTFSAFSSLKILDLSYNHLISLDEGMFNGLSNLQELYLGANQFWSLTRGIFSNITNLQILDLSNCRKLNDLNDNAFIGLGNLQQLNLYESEQLINLSDYVFAELINLQQLNLGWTSLKRMGNRTFSHLSNLQWLSLSNNELSDLDDQIFANLSNLQTLDLHQNNFVNLDNNVFASLSKLQELDLGVNLFTALHGEMFTGLINLKTLDLSASRLGDIALKNMTIGFPFQLNTLNLFMNDISNMEPLAEILACTNLTTVDFEDNPINDSALLITLQQNTLKKVCEDQRCHANLPPSESCSVTLNSIAVTQTIWGSGRSISDYPHWLHAGEAPLFEPVLALSSATSTELVSSLLTPAAAGVMILGVLGISVLFYKNSTWMQAIVNTGSNLFQHCWSGGKTQEAKTTPPARSSNRRYTIFQHLPTFCSQKSSSFTKITSVALR